MRSIPTLFVALIIVCNSYTHTEPNMANHDSDSLPQNLIIAGATITVAATVTGSIAYGVHQLLQWMRDTKGKIVALDDKCTTLHTQYTALQEEHEALKRTHAQASQQLNADLLTQKKLLDTTIAETALTKEKLHQDHRKALDDMGIIHIEQVKKIARRTRYSKVSPKTTYLLAQLSNSEERHKKALDKIERQNESIMELTRVCSITLGALKQHSHYSTQNIASTNASKPTNERLAQRIKRLEHTNTSLAKQLRELHEKIARVITQPRISSAALPFEGCDGIVPEMAIDERSDCTTTISLTKKTASLPSKKICAKDFLKLPTATALKLQLGGTSYIGVSTLPLGRQSSMPVPNFHKLLNRGVRKIV